MKNIVYVIPFACFLLGYFLLSIFVHGGSMPVPQLVGIPVQDALVLLSAQNLNARVQAQQENADVNPGTVLRQKPEAGQKIKANQSVYLVVARAPTRMTAPSFIGMTVQDALEEAKKAGIKTKQSLVPYAGAGGFVVSQAPAAGKEMDGSTVTFYVSEGIETAPRLMPNLVGQNAQEVVAELEKQQIACKVERGPEAEGFALDQCVVVTQKPLAGALLEANKLPRVLILVAAMPGVVAPEAVTPVPDAPSASSKREDSL